MRSHHRLLGPLAFLIAAGEAAATAPPALAPQSYSYADLVDIAQSSPVVVVADVTRSGALKPKEAPGLAPGLARVYVEADVAALLHGADGLPSRVSFLADVPADARGRAPKLRKLRLLLFARPAPGAPGTLQLSGTRGETLWTPELEQRTRAVLTAIVARDQPPHITGIANAFHVPGSLPGESETQIFLNTADRRPVSLTVLRRPGAEPSWAVALGELTDEAAAPPARDTLLWYRLACGLPPALPDSAVADLPGNDAAAARADYTVVLRGLGACGRTSGDAQAQPS